MTTAQLYNWLQVLGTAERSQIHQRVGQQLYAIVPLLDTFKAQQQPLELIFPRKGPLDTHASRMDSGVEQPLTPAPDTLTVAGILLDIGDHARIENALPIVRRIKATIEIEIGSAEVHTNLFGHLLQGFQALREQHHVGLIDGSHRNRR